MRSCDGCTVEVMSRMRGGGRHKDKKNKAEKRQAESQERLERKCDEEPESDRRFRRAMWRRNKLRVRK